jgi:hypothetical protein
VRGRWNGKGTDDYRAGDEFEAGLAAGYSPLAWLTLFGQLNYSDHGAGVAAHGGEPAHSATRSLYATPGLSVRAGPRLSVYALVQSRVWGETDDANVVASRHFLFGTTLAPPR